MYAIVAPADGSLSAFARRSSSPSSKPRPAVAVPNPVAPRSAMPTPTTRAAASPSASASVSAFAFASASAPIVGRIPGFRRRVAECNEITAIDVENDYVPLAVAGVSVGLLQHHHADALCRAGPDVFRRVGAEVVMDPEDSQTSEQRTAAAAPVMKALADAGVVGGWRDELFPVVANYGDEPLLLVERAAASLLGIRAFGVHVNGYVTLPDGSKELWVARRSAAKQTFPGKLDHLVAGGLPAGVPPGACVVKECGEEASIPPELASEARPVGIVSYAQKYQGCCKRDVLFCYDLELPEDFVPKPDDGEVESFERYAAERAAETVAETTEFKTNCTLVIIDWFVRHGLIGPEEPGYADLVASLRRGDM